MFVQIKNSEKTNINFLLSYKKRFERKKQSKKVE